MEGHHISSSEKNSETDNKMSTQNQTNSTSNSDSLVDRNSNTKNVKAGIISRTSDGDFDDPLLNIIDNGSDDDDDAISVGAISPPQKYLSSGGKVPESTKPASHHTQSYPSQENFKSSDLKTTGSRNVGGKSVSAIGSNDGDPSTLEGSGTSGNNQWVNPQIITIKDATMDTKRFNQNLGDHCGSGHQNTVSYNSTGFSTNSGQCSADLSAEKSGNSMGKLEFVMDHYYQEEVVEPDVVEVVVKNGGRIWVGSQGGPMPEKDEIRGEVEVEVLTADLSQELGEVGRYSYSGLVSHSLFILFEYAPWHRKYQDELVKNLLDHLRLSKQLETTMLLLTGGEVDMETCDPFIEALRKDPVLQKEGAQCLPYDLVSIAVRDGLYDARTRSIAKFISLKLCISKRTFEAVEELVLKVFLEEQHETTEEEQEEKKQRARKRKIKKAAIIGIAAVGGGVLIGLTGGLAAPLIAAGVGAAVGTGGVILGSVAGIAIMGSLFGVAGAGLTGYKMNKRIGDLEEFEFEPLTSGHSLHVTIVISGWLTAKHNDFKEAWYGLANSNEQYALRFESRYLKPLGDALEYVIKAAISTAVKEGLKHTVLAGLLAAITWPLALVSVASIIDNPWSTCTQRSVNAGRQLAEVLLSRQQGKRPITLIGYSFGARVIFACLQEMSRRKNSEGIVEEAILLGAPVTASVEEWSSFSRVVSGRVVNGYCRSDWLLKFMYRTASVQFSIAGLTPIDWRHRLMHNVDLSDIITGHLDYFSKMDEVLDLVGIATKPHLPLGVSDSLRQLSAAQKDGYNRMSQAGRESPGVRRTGNKNNLVAVEKRAEPLKTGTQNKNDLVAAEKHAESLQTGSADRTRSNTEQSSVEIVGEPHVGSSAEVGEPQIGFSIEPQKGSSIEAVGEPEKGSSVETVGEPEKGSSVEAVREPQKCSIAKIDGELQIDSSVKTARPPQDDSKTEFVGEPQSGPSDAVESSIISPSVEEESTKKAWSGIETLV